MDLAVTYIVRLGLGVLLAVMMGLLGLAVAMLAIPPIKAGESGYLFVRVGLIGATCGIGGAVAWAMWRDRRRDTHILLWLAMSGGVVGAVASYTWVDSRFDGLDALEQAAVSGRTTLLTAVVGANLLAAIYSATGLIRALLRKTR